MNCENKKRNAHLFRWIVFSLLTVAPRMVFAQDSLVVSRDTVIVSKTGEIEETGEAEENEEAEEAEKMWEVEENGEMDRIDSIFLNFNDRNIFGIADSSSNNLASNEETKSIITTTFKPNPRTATMMALFPGLGHIYNRQYWKLPIIYGGLMGCMYAITWNNKTYSDYKEAYFSVMTDAKADPNAEHPETWSDRWQVFVPSSIDPAMRLHDTNFQNNLKRGKDYFRRYREMSWIIMIAVYGISIADAYVDAQMFDFDVSPDLSFHLTPVFKPETLFSSRSYGFNICMTF